MWFPWFSWVSLKYWSFGCFKRGCFQIFISWFPSFSWFPVRTPPLLKNYSGHGGCETCFINSCWSWPLQDDEEEQEEDGDSEGNEDAMSEDDGRGENDEEDEEEELDHHRAAAHPSPMLVCGVAPCFYSEIVGFPLPRRSEPCQTTFPCKELAQIVSQWLRIGPYSRHRALRTLVESTIWTLCSIFLSKRGYRPLQGKPNSRTTECSGF